MNDTPLHSTLWYRVAALRPRLVARARLHRHRYRGEVWYLLQDPASSKVHRFTPAARLVLAAMDGQRTVQELWELAARQLGADAPSQDDLIGLLGQLHAADLLMTDVLPDALELFERGFKERQSRRRRSWVNPMSIRIPLWDPGRFLDRHAGLWRWLWGRPGAVLWLLAVLPALALLPSRWPELSHNVADRVLQPDNLIVVGLLFPMVKFLHEMGHATACRAAGGEVHDMGVMLLVLMPVPYVDASSSSVLGSRWARARIGAAGMATELFVAALAFYLWMLVEPGLLRAALFNVMLVAGVSTLVFNGNPLLRYDAYYILADLIELPNLAAQSARHWGYLIQRHLLRLGTATPVAHSPGERAWFAAYGLLSAVYRVFVGLAIALFVGSRFFFIGVLLALWATAMMVVAPIVKSARALAAQPEAREHRGRVWGTLAASLGALAVLLAAVPMPHRTVAEGVVWLPEQAIVRAGAPGFFQSLEVAPGVRVDPGTLLVRSVDPALDAQASLLRARVQELEASYAAEFVADRAKAEMVREQLEHERAGLARAVQKRQELQVASAASGRFVVPQATDLPGRHFRQGEVIGFVIGDEPPVVRVALDQASIDAVTSATRDVRMRLAGLPEVTHEGRILRLVPAGRGEVFSAALASGGGGRIASDPRDPQGRRTLERVFELDVGFVSPQAASPPFGHRVYLRFDHPPEPLAAQLWRAVRRLFLRHFDV
jgi:putative peptide zinc metalloprotease protein